MDYLETLEKQNLSWIISEYFKPGNLGTIKLLPDQGNNYWNFGTLLINGTRICILRETTEEKGSENYDNSSQTTNHETVPPGIVKFLKSQFICYLR